MFGYGFRNRLYKSENASRSVNWYNLSILPALTFRRPLRTNSFEERTDVFGFFEAPEWKVETYSHYKDFLSEMFELPRRNFTFRQSLEANIDKAIERVKAFDNELTKFNDSSEFISMKVKELKNYTPNLDIDWVQIINDQLINAENISEEDEIMLNSPSTLRAIVTLLERLDKRFVSVEC